MPTVGSAAVADVEGGILAVRIELEVCAEIDVDSLYIAGAAF